MAPVPCCTLSGSGNAVATVRERPAVHSPCNVDSWPDTSLPTAAIFPLGQVVMSCTAQESEPPTNMNMSGDS